MNRSARTLAGVLTLAALAFSFTETVFASMCAPMPDMGAMEDMELMAAHAPAMTQGAPETTARDAPGCPLMSGDVDRDDQEEREPHCPLSPAVGSGCSAVASFPAGQIAAVAWTAGTSASFASPAAGTDLLLTHGLFRPPRA